MIRYAEILNGVVRHIGTGPLLPHFAPPLYAVDVTDREPLPAEGSGYDPDTGQFTEPPAATSGPLSPLAFLRRFDVPERLAIRSSEDVVVRDFIGLLELAAEVRRDDPDTVAGMAYLVASGLMTQARADAILDW